MSVFPPPVTATSKAGPFACMMAPLLLSVFVEKDKLTGGLAGPVLSLHAKAPAKTQSVNPVFQNFIMMQLP